LRETAATPVAGIPPRPVTCTSITWPGPTLAAAAPRPERVSRMRAGLTAVKPPGVAGGPVAARAAGVPRPETPNRAGTTRTSQHRRRDAMEVASATAAWA